MPRPVKVRVLQTGLYKKPSGFGMSAALRDCTAGKVYDAWLFEPGEVNDGTVATAQEVAFIDDAGDYTVPHLHPLRLEVLDE